MNLKCIIVDDDVHSINGLKSYISIFTHLQLCAIYTDPLEALAEIGGKPPVDIIFMDVDMPMITGIELSKVIRHKTDKLIFTTAHAKYAYEAFEIRANDFLLKPYTIARFAEAINRLFPKQETMPATDITKREDYFFVRNKNERNNLVRIRYADIIVIESLQNYIRIYTINQAIVTYISLSEIRETLKEYPFFLQVHRSFIISHNHISKIEGHTILMIDGMELTIGKHYREQVMDYVKQKTIRTNRT